MAKKKIQLQDANGNVLHPLTLGECVTMSNGENLDTLMSKSQMFTPTITQDKSMFKVGTGADVDYSANVKDGAYESLVFKGKSLVNLMPAKTVFEKQAIGGTSGWKNSYLPLTQELKTNTIYTLFYKLETETKVQISIGGKNSDAFLLKSEPIREVGTHYVQTLLTTKPETSNSMSHLYMQFPDNFDVGTVKATNMVLLEGNYMDFNVPYFEGLGSCKMPILQNVGKNLFDVNMTNFTNVTAIPIDGSLIIKKNTNPHYYSRTPIHLKPNTKYTFKCNTYRESDTETYVKLHLGARPHNDSLEYGGYVVPVGDGTFSKTFTTNSLGDLYINGYTTTKGILLSNIQLEESSTATSYEDHKTNILRTSEEIVLREVNGVQDTYNALTGEYVQRIGERDYQEGDLANPNVITDGVKTQYELAESTTTIIKPLTIPFAYQNGHVILESGYEGQSLLPEVEYSVVTGRTGQVTQNTKILRKQEQQITGLEELLLTQIVQMEYERTLLQFDYELQMMMLG